MGSSLFKLKPQGLHKPQILSVGGQRSRGLFLPPAAALQLHLLEPLAAWGEPPSHTMHCPYSSNRVADSLINQFPQEKRVLERFILK